MTIAECNSPVAENIARIIAEKGLKQVLKKPDIAHTG